MQIPERPTHLKDETAILISEKDGYYWVTINFFIDKLCHMNVCMNSENNILESEENENEHKKSLRTEC